MFLHGTKKEGMVKDHPCSELTDLKLSPLYDYFLNN